VIDSFYYFSISIIFKNLAYIYFYRVTVSYKYKKPSCRYDIADRTASQQTYFIEIAAK